MTTDNSPLLDDLRIVSAQESALVFTHFNHDTAWRLGTALRNAASERNAPLTIEIRLGRQILFQTALPGTAALNADWVRRKGDTVAHFGRSSYGVGLTLQRDQTSIENKYGLAAQHFATHGGGFPIRLKQDEKLNLHPDSSAEQNANQPAAVITSDTPALLIGTIAVSGLPQRDDHQLIVDVLSVFLGVAVSALPTRV